MSEENKHFGIIIPASNITIESELYAALNSNVHLQKRIFLHFARAGFHTRYKVSGERYLTEVVESLPTETQKLAKIHNLQSMTFMCTSGAAVLMQRKDIQKEISMHYQGDWITPVESLLAAFTAVGSSNPLIVTPYTSKISANISQLLSDAAITPKKVISLGLNTSSQLFEYSRERLSTLLEAECNNNTYDGVCVMCTNFPTFRIINEIEKECGIPVISSNQATLYRMLKEAKVNEKIYGFGSLLH